MRSARPLAIGNNIFRVEAETPLQLETLTQGLPVIKAFLAEKLNNDEINFETSIRHGDPLKHVLNDRELLGEIIKENPAMTEMMDVLKLRLG